MSAERCPVHSWVACNRQGKKLVSMQVGQNQGQNGSVFNHSHAADSWTDWTQTAIDRVVLFERLNPETFGDLLGSGRITSRTCTTM